MNQRLTVLGMSCTHCEQAVKRAIAQVDAQAEVRIDLGAQQVEVVSAQGRAALVKAIEAAGYTVAQAPL